MARNGLDVKDKEKKKVLDAVERKYTRSWEERRVLSFKHTDMIQVREVCTVNCNHMQMICGRDGSNSH